jgi:hypothetical protein
MKSKWLPWILLPHLNSSNLEFIQDAWIFGVFSILQFYVTLLYETSNQIKTIMTQRKWKTYKLQKLLFLMKRKIGKHHILLSRQKTWNNLYIRKLCFENLGTSYMHNFSIVIILSTIWKIYYTKSTVSIFAYQCSCKLTFIFK